MTAVTRSQVLTIEAVQAGLRTRTVGRRLHLLEEVDSTNSVALTLAAAGAKDGTVVMAEGQTAGRGRQGRSWFSPPGDNLYSSLIVRRNVPRERLAAWLSWVPLASALALAHAVRDMAGLEPTVKWPNDVLIGTRKVSGVLCETAGFGAEAPVVVVGVGLNVNTPHDRFPEDLRETATSLAAEAGRPFDRAAILAELLNQLEAYLDRLLGPEIGALADEYRARCATLGRRVRVSLADGAVVTGLAESIGPDGALLVAPEGPPPITGERRLVEIRAGDVVHLR
ncbi:biotin--[acetyl-CoA-carboxylase] ligase [Nitrospira sp. Kam-Ns4a]